MLRTWRAACLLLCVVPIATASDQSTDQPQGLRRAIPTCWALTSARLVLEPGRTLETGTIIIRDGRIAGIGENIEIPPDARAVNLTGKTIYAGLIDAYTTQPVSTTSVEEGFPYWNAEIRPQLNVSTQIKPSDSENNVWRKQGITARLVAPEGGIFKGTGAVILTSNAPRDELLIRDQASLHARLTTTRGSTRYPNSPMGAVALARQAMYDAQWYRDAQQSVSGDVSLPHPDRNDALSALMEAVEARTPFLVETSNELFVLRADDFAREFGLNLVVVGNGNEYRRLEDIRVTGRTLIVPVNFPKAPNVGTAETALDVSLEALMHWDHAPENPARLEAAGIRFALSSLGLEDRSKFLEKVRIAVDRGLSPDAALAALTTIPAEIFQLEDQVGTLATGKLANLVVSDGPLFEKKTTIVETWVAGERFEHDPGLDRQLAGTWKLRIKSTDSPAALKLVIKQEKSKLSATVVRDSEEPVKLKNLVLNDARLSGTIDAKVLGNEGLLRFTAVIDADNVHGLGQMLLPDESFVAIEIEKVEAADAAAEEVEKEKPEADGKADSPVTIETEKMRQDAAADAEGETKEASEPAEPVRASFDVNFPLGAFGVKAAPEQPRRFAIENVTVWTNTEAGIIDDATVLIGEGRILRVGRDIKIPKKLDVFDGTGLHLTPGIIDCHSHMATDGGINESGQAITAEVRIGDFINCDDINIYRQLAGGVTSANVLHGSANPIGGQNQVIKLRWGANCAEMKFAEAPAGIKFALGENVKQSNWSEATGRYPQSRMGVEQIFIDEFRAANEYMQRWKQWNANRNGLPPRKDLELETIAQILRGERWIHCHSYRQDEILALIRVADEFDIQIATLQHILEGYKVADEMARHGIMGSAFSDWWAYKYEVVDAIPYAGALMHEAGVVVSFNSDDRELARHLNHEAAKAVKYGGVAPEEALKFVTLNPARQLRIDEYVGSIERGKHADFVLWSGSPLSPMSRCEQTWIDGRKYFDRKNDTEQRVENNRMRAALIQKILDSGADMAKPGQSSSDESDLWPDFDEYCAIRGALLQQKIQNSK